LWLFKTDGQYFAPCEGKVHFALFATADNALEQTGVHGKGRRVVTRRATKLSGLLQRLFVFHWNPQKMCNVS